MCASGNQSIYRQCRDAILKKNGRHPIRNREMREIIKAHGGCMMSEEVVFGRRVLDADKLMANALGI